ncbi:MAG: 2-C-methyl-D-erythritol 4-phosphate cytidylyltransferase [bacterium]
MGLIYKKITIGGDKGEMAVNALFDTGASESFIHENIANQIATTLKLHLPRRFELGKGTMLVDTSTGVLDVIVNGANLFGAFLVAKELSEEAILGADFLQRWKISIDIEKEELLIDEKALKLKLASANSANNKKVCAILAAAGQGKRLGKPIPKAVVMLSNHPMIYYSLKVLSESELIDYILVVVPKEGIAYCQREVVEKYKFAKVDKVIEGGKHRQDSIYNGLKEVLPNTDLILIHDGVRPFVTHQLIEETIADAKEVGAAIVGVPPIDTIKSINNGQWIEETWDRDSIVMIQTPQAFKYDILKDAYEKAYQDNFYATDDALLVRRLGGRVKLVKGDYENIKITVPHDLLAAEAILKLRESKGENGYFKVK